MIKTISLATLLLTSTIALNANNIDKSIIDYEKNKFSNNSRVEIKNIEINTKVKVPVENWYGYIIDISAIVQNKNIKGKDIIFSNGTVVSPDLIDLKTGKSLRALLQPKLTDIYYNKKHLIAGNENAKDKIVIFSDPLCPFCIDYVPEVIKHVNKNRESIALYYYHFPLLKLHPAANTLTKLMEIGKEKGIENIELKVYGTDWEEYFKSDSNDEKLILKTFNKLFKLEITLEELNSEKVTKVLEDDISMGDDLLVKGTPTIFINGEKDNTRLKYESLGNN